MNESLSKIRVQPSCVNPSFGVAGLIADEKSVERRPVSLG